MGPSDFGAPLGARGVKTIILNTKSIFVNAQFIICIQNSSILMEMATSPGAFLDLATSVSQCIPTRSAVCTADASEPGGRLRRRARPCCGGSAGARAARAPCSTHRAPLHPQHPPYPPACGTLTRPVVRRLVADGQVRHQHRREEEPAHRAGDMMNTAGFNVDVRLCNPPTGNNVRWPVGAFLESVSVNLAANINALHAVTVLLVGGDPALDAALRDLACQVVCRLTVGSRGSAQHPTQHAAPRRSRARATGRWSAP